MPENDNIHFRSDRPDWETPKDIFDALDAEFGPFTLDAAASSTTAKCLTFFTEAQDGLAQDWGVNRTWVNPPYGRRLGLWVEKAINASAAGATVVMLVPARPETVWFREAFEHASDVRFHSGRITFVGAPNPAPFPSVAFVFRPTPTWSRTERVTYTLPTRHGSRSDWYAVKTKVPS